MTKTLTLAAFAFAASLPSAPQQLRLATVYDVKPAAFVAAEGVAEGQPLLVGQALYQGQRVWTQPAGRAGLALVDGSVLRLEGASELAIEAPVGAAGALLKLARGLLRLDAAKQAAGSRLRVQTSAGVAGIKGTQLQVDARDGRTEVKVLEGQVELKALNGGASVLIHAQEAAVSYPDRVDAVRKLSQQEVKALKGAMKELVDQKKREYTKRVRDARGKRTQKQEGK